MNGFRGFAISLSQSPVIAFQSDFLQRGLAVKGLKTFYVDSLLTEWPSKPF